MRRLIDLPERLDHKYSPCRFDDKGDCMATVAIDNAHCILCIHTQIMATFNSLKMIMNNALILGDHAHTYSNLWEIARNTSKSLEQWIATTYPDKIKQIRREVEDFFKKRKDIDENRKSLYTT
jgi:hypothetical protein